MLASWEESKKGFRLFLIGVEQVLGGPLKKTRGFGGAIRCLEGKVVELKSTLEKRVFRVGKAFVRGVSATFEFDAAKGGG
ncbi:hypothetical protein Lal_00004074 [Lupinus albus]|nr:hypothetical protein Lal_00004074 [Lupinus albus]